MDTFATECAGFKVISAAASSRNFERIKRVGRAGQRLYFGLLRKTATGCPPAMLVDAAISLADAISSFCRMRKAMEITRQLEIRNDALRHEIENIKKMIELRERNELREAELDTDENVRCVRLKKENLLKFGEMLRMVSESLNFVRECDLSSSQSATALEKKFFDTMLLYLEAAESAI